MKIFQNEAKAIAYWLSAIIIIIIIIIITNCNWVVTRWQ
jgi:hypothetical protein